MGIWLALQKCAQNWWQCSFVIPALRMWKVEDRRSSVLVHPAYIMTTKCWAYRNLLSWGITGQHFCLWNGVVHQVFGNRTLESEWVPWLSYRWVLSMHMITKFRRVKNFLKYYFNTWVSLGIFGKFVSTKVLYQQNLGRYPCSEIRREEIHRGEQSVSTEIWWEPGSWRVTEAIKHRHWWWVAGTSGTLRDLIEKQQTLLVFVPLVSQILMRTLLKLFLWMAKIRN